MEKQTERPLCVIAVLKLRHRLTWVSIVGYLFLFVRPCHFVYQNGILTNVESRIATLHLQDLLSTYTVRVFLFSNSLQLIFAVQLAAYLSPTWTIEVSSSAMSLAEEHSDNSSLHRTEVSPANVENIKSTLTMHFQVQALCTLRGLHGCHCGRGRRSDDASPCQRALPTSKVDHKGARDVTSLRDYDECMADQSRPTYVILFYRLTHDSTFMMNAKTNVLCFTLKPWFTIQTRASMVSTYGYTVNPRTLINFILCFL